MKTALIFGISGQAGRYLSEYLYSTGKYKIHGTYNSHWANVSSAYATLHQVDITRKIATRQLIELIAPDEVYNLASKMFAPASWENPDGYTQVTYGCLPTILDTLVKCYPKARYFQAGSASVFDLSHVPQAIYTPMRPKDPYGVAKMAAQNLVRAYRENKGMYACTGVIFNMESPLRPLSFFANRVCKEAVEIAAGKKSLMTLGSLAAKRDWGWTEEYVRAMHLMLQQPVPEDFVIGTGESHTCLEFVQEALKAAHASLNSFTYDESGSAALDTLQADIVYTSQYLRWKASIKFKEVILRLVAHYAESVETQVSGKIKQGDVV